MKGTTLSRDPRHVTAVVENTSLHHRADRARSGRQDLDMIGLKKIRDFKGISPLPVIFSRSLFSSNAVEWCIEGAQACLEFATVSHTYSATCMFECDSMRLFLIFPCTKTATTTRSTMAAEAWTGRCSSSSVGIDSFVQKAKLMKPVWSKQRSRRTLHKRPLSITWRPMRLHDCLESGTLV